MFQLLLDVTYDKQLITLYYQKYELDLAAEAYRIRYSAEFITAFALCIADRLNDIAGDFESTNNGGRVAAVLLQREEIQARRLVVAALKDAQEAYRKSLFEGYLLDRLETNIRNATRIKVSGCDVKARAFATESIRTPWRNTATIDNNLVKVADEYVKCLEHVQN